VELAGRYQLPEERQIIWVALNDVEVLKQHIAGCEKLDKLADDRFEALIRAKMGPVNALFKTTIELQDIVPPESYTLVVKGQGGSAGMGEGTAKVNLTEQDGFTELAYSVELNVYGKLAQVGSRLMKSTINKLSDEFFRGFCAQFGAATESSPPATKRSWSKAAIVAVGATIVALIVLWIVVN